MRWVGRGGRREGQGKREGKRGGGEGCSFMCKKTDLHFFQIELQTFKFFCLSDTSSIFQLKSNKKVLKNLKEE